MPTVNVVLCRAGDAGARRWLTVSVKLCVASGPTPLCAVNVSGYAPALLPACRSARPRGEGHPLGSAPVSLNVGAGEPVAVTVNVPAVPTVNVVLFALVIGRRPG